MTDFIENNGQPATQHLDQLVGEGKKYKTVEDLAKAYVHVESFAENLKRENGEQRDELTQRLSIAELVRNLKPTEQPPAAPAAQPNPVEQSKPITEEDLVARIRDVMKNDSAQERASTNAAQVINRLKDTFGDNDKINEFVSGKAAELKLNVEWLQDVAKQNPDAFFKLVGLDAQPHGTPGASKPEINTSSLNQYTAKPDTYAYFEQMRRDNPKEYYRPATQNRIMKAALERGESFYK